MSERRALGGAAAGPCSFEVQLLRSIFLRLSHNRAFRAFAEMPGLGRRASRRFVAGVTIEEAIEAVERLNREGFDVSVDALCEHVIQVSQAEETAAIYHRLLDAIAARGLRANISLALTQVGLDIGGHGAGPALAERITGEIVDHAARLGRFVRIDMESSAYTEETIAITERLHAQWPRAIGTVLQAYLFRTTEDVERLLQQGISLRLCKGAYDEPPDVAFASRFHVDENFVRLMKRLVTSGISCGIATHDEQIVAALEAFVDQGGADKHAFEFQMLYGVRRDLQRRLLAAGYRVRIYMPFGTEWYPYFMRRLSERPANVIFLAKTIFKD